MRMEDARILRVDIGAWQAAQAGGIVWGTDE